MKVGDLVIMPGETLAKVSGQCSVGLVVADDYHALNRYKSNKRIGIMWSGENQIDYEPREWLKVINNK